MTRRFAWLLSSWLIAASAWAEDRSESNAAAAPRAESPVPPSVGFREVADGERAVAAPPIAVVAADSRPTCFLGVELLQWWYKTDNIPALLNTARETNTLFDGTALDPNAQTLFGSSQYDYRTIPGIRALLSVAVVDNVDFELGGFLMESKSIDASFAGTNGQPFLTRPFYNVHDLVEASFDTSSMSGISGDFNVATQNQLYGYEANLAWYAGIPDNALRKLSLGFRQVSLNESLVVTENVRANGPGFLAFYPTVDANGQLVSYNFDPATQSIRIVDRFAASNQFYGPQAGAQWRWSRRAFSFDLLAKVAVGVNRETIRVGGNTSLLTGGVVTATGTDGLLAVSTNSGSKTSNEFAVVPELGVKFNFDLTRRIQLNVGYSVLYMSSAVRPGTQIDRRINPQLVPSDVAYNPNTTGPFLPRAFFRDTDFCAHGVSFGMVVSY